MDRYPRQLRNVIRHSTPRRFFNLLLVELEMKLGRTKLWGRPYIAFVDPINLCNLRCPLCPTGTNELMRAQGTMDLHLFQHTIDEVAPWAFEITLYNWGEPLLHKNIFEMIRYAASKNLATSISSNFNRLRPGDIDRLIDSGLEYLSVSIDGASPETYAQYRRQPASAERPDSVAGEAAPRFFQSRCYHLYRSITVNPGGGAAPRCIVYDEQADTGNIREGVGNLWNNESYRSARAEFNARESPTLETISTGCHIFAKAARHQEPVRQQRGSANGIPLPVVDAADLVGAALGRDGATVTLPSEGGDV